MGLILQKGCPYEPNCFAMKIMLGIMAFLSVVMFAAYSANLISMLLTVNVEFPFNNYHSFYYDSNYEFGHVSGSSFDELFQVSMENCSSFSHLKSAVMYKHQYLFLLKFHVGWLRITEENI